MNGRQLYSGLLSLLLASASVTCLADTAAKSQPPKTAPQCMPVIQQAWIRSAPPGAQTLAGYLILKNPCKTSFRVVDVESRDFGMPMIHRTVVENGISKMRDPGVLEVKPGTSLKFEAGGLHIMLMQPLRALKEGDKAGVRLVLADGRRVFSEFPVLKEAPKR
ncbi:MAG TPA: copper chaperone PCu(A)C [Arenimonas sp.]|nr:copper chaperone PCu(A)C [Arenimonas sp.]HPO24954.1 copper chaperone PCu(A)C [Arenimonas sp.]HPW33032.1 copper chaperone PCu(A)C [Arenimonas sp.]HPW34035.1 copper chaperone PCu(A)C [Arenimonas sp.]